MYSDYKQIGSGGGGKFAVTIKDDFAKGECGVSTTYDNDLLSDEE